MRMNGYHLSAIALLGLVSACGGSASSSSSSSSTTTTTQVAAGVWESNYTSASGDTIQGLLLVSSTNEFVAAAVDETSNCETICFGSGVISGASLTATDAFGIATYNTLPWVNTSCTFSDSTTSGTGTLAGTVTTGSSINVTTAGTTTGGTALTSTTETYTFSNMNSTTPSLSTIAGTYTDTDGSTITVSATGVLSEVNTTTGCRVTGSLSVPDTSHNIYAISVTYSACLSTYASIDGLTMSGLATYNATGSPANLIVGMRGTLNGTTLAFFGAYPS